MLNLSTTIRAALEGDPGLTSRLGVGNVYQMWPAGNIPPPILSFDITENQPSFGADDAEYSSGITVTIDAAHRDNGQLTGMLLDVNRIMVGIGFVRDSYGPLGQNGGAFTRMIRFKAEMEA